MVALTNHYDLKNDFNNQDLTHSFFKKLILRLNCQFDGHLIVVGHLLPTLPPFLYALEQIGNIAGIIPKPKSIDPKISLLLSQNHYQTIPMSREEFNHPDRIISIIKAFNDTKPLILLDLGGYFARISRSLSQAFPDRLIGVVEGTENGHQKYLQHPPNVPCVSVARSLAKRTEDYWIGQAILFSAESLLRKIGTTLNGKQFFVIGFGKIGQSIAHNLKNRGLGVAIWDIDPNQRLYARCKNFPVLEKYQGLPRSDVIFCATGHKALSGQDFHQLKTGGIVFSVTSSDDEFCFEEMVDYHRQYFQEHHLLRLWKEDGHFFYLANQGNAINFLHGSETRPYIHLVQGAILAGIDTLVKNEGKAGCVTNLSREKEANIATIFEEVFFPNNL